jgi:class 3 adenylate cyclase
MLYTEPSYAGVEDDQIFGQAIAQTTGFVGTVFLGEDGATTNWPAGMPAPPEMRGLADWLAERGRPRVRLFPGGSERGRGASLIMPTATFPVPEVATNADLLGNVHGTPDADAIFRRVELFSVFAGKAVPCLGLAAYLVAAPGETLSIEPGMLTINSRSDIPGPASDVQPSGKPEFLRSPCVTGCTGISDDFKALIAASGQATSLLSGQSTNERAQQVAPIQSATLFETTVFRDKWPLAAKGGAGASRNSPSPIQNQKSKIGNAFSHSVPLDRRGRALLNFRGPSGTHQRFSAASVIQSESRLQEGAGAEPPIKDPAAFKDCYVFLGCNAPGLLDLRPSPLSRVYPGVEIFATALDNLLSDDFMRNAPRGFTLACILVMGLLAGILTRLGRHAGDNLISIVLTIPIPVVLCVVAYQQGFWLQFLAQEAAVVFALAGGVLVNYATEGKQKRFIRGAFKQYLSEEVIEQLTLHPERLTLGGEQRALSIFFSDLQGFTTISEALNPQELTALLNDYLTAMTDIIQEEGGTVDKYEGDAIIAFWNAPLAQEDHARRAVRTSLRCQAKLAELRPEFRARVGKDMFMRIGLNTGAVVVGNMGSRNRFNYTILGDAANLASRLEGINKQFGTFTLISETTQAALGGEFPAREISRVAVVGRKTAVRVFEPHFPEEFAKRQQDFEVFARGLAAYYAGDFAAALRAFEALQEKDPPAAAYVRKCRALAERPVTPWDGVWVMTEK